jgi:hypothetical protein
MPDSVVIALPVLVLCGTRRPLSRLPQSSGLLVDAPHEAT